MKPIFEIRVSSDHKEYFVLRARNGKVILTSEMYCAHQNVLKGIESVRVNCRKFKQFDKRMDKVGLPYFVLRAGNYKVIGDSQAYATEWGRTKGIMSVMLNGKTKYTVNTPEVANIHRYKRRELEAYKAKQVVAA